MPKWIPKDMEWFLAELIQELRPADAEESTVWVNTILIQAKSVEEAYEKSLDHGKLYETTYKNTDGVEVTERFRGLRDLLLIYERLEHGSEIMWADYGEIPEEEIRELITPKEKLGAFVLHAPEPEPTDGDKS
jgi:hypothetical protein